MSKITSAGRARISAPVPQGGSVIDSHIIIQTPYPPPAGP